MRRIAPRIRSRSFPGRCLMIVTLLQIESRGPCHLQCLRVFILAIYSAFFLKIFHLTRTEFGGKVSA